MPSVKKCDYLSLLIYLWLAETSQQPISQTTWLVTPHFHHYAGMMSLMCCQNAGTLTILLVQVSCQILEQND
jgi:hypothetical protein